MASREAHAVVLPFPTQGHLAPLLHLSHQLANAGILVTLFHTPTNFALLAPVPSPRLRFQIIHHLQDQHCTTTPALDQILPPFPETLELTIREINLQLGQNRAVTCLISDSFMPWTLNVANKLGIPRVEFWTSSASGYAIGYHLPRLIAKGYLPFKPGTENEVIDFVSGVAPFRLADLASDLLLVQEESHPVFQFLFRAFRHAKESARVLVNSFYDLESSALNALNSENVRIIPIGPLLPAVTTERTSSQASLLPQDVDCLQWLDDMPDASVLFLSFGSASTFSVDEIQELAFGLETSQQPFLWAIRPGAVDGSLRDVLPVGFQMRTQQRGLVVSWAPQLAVLAHRALVGFLSHCGWNSILESLWMGVPVIGYPISAEQNTNLKLIKDWGVGISMAGKGCDGMTREAVEEAIKALMLGEAGAFARRRAMDIKVAARQAMGDAGSSASSLQEFVEELKACGAFSQQNTVVEEGRNELAL